MADFTEFTESNGYPPALESTEIVSIRQTNELYIAGEWRPPAQGQYVETTNPATGEVLAKIAVADEFDVHDAVNSAREAYEGKWSMISAAERGRLLFQLARKIQDHSKELALLETLDGGKPIRESHEVDLPLVASHFFYYAGWADKLEFAFPGREVRALGVCGQIIPWNFPLLMAAWKIAPALACGNTVVLKPTETTSLSLIRLMELIEEVGFPAGVVNLVTGGAETGDYLVKHGDVDMIAFTGSTEVGKEIQRSIAETHKRYTLELGGKSAQIVFEDAAIDQAIEGVVNGIFFNQGHVCSAGSRLLVQEGIHDQFVGKLKERMASLQVGDPLDRNTDIGAIHSKKQLDVIAEIVNRSSKQGCEIWDAGQQLPNEDRWYRPTLLLGCSQSHEVVREEIFGPVLTVQTFRTPDEALEKANNTPYGLSGGVWTDKGAKSLAVASEVNAGVIWVNTYNKFDPSSPYGGCKESGVGRGGGLHGLAPYLEITF